MPEIDAQVKKWGNTLGIRVPAAVAHAAGIKPGDEVHVKIEKVNRPNPEFFGIAKRKGWNLGTPEEFLKWREAERARERDHAHRLERAFPKPTPRRKRA